MNERDLFIAAVQFDDDGKRASYLDEACARDVELRQRVDALLKAFGQAGKFLQQPVAGLAPPLDVPFLEKPGDTIGLYKLLEQIGEGGFGVVFLSEQDRPVRRKVALKIIKPGMDTRRVIARFEAERQALAMMDHPNIAKVFDAGATENGRPYFVMELVQGVPITEYCDRCNLTTRERLELFVSVCKAVQHAHQKGVIHRDLKPTNVLVTMQDGRPAPKIIDFGVAKAIDQRLTEHTLTTAYAQMIGSPLYMSPEQAELSPLGVDTRSDIYSLGVMLYELLTGTTPFDKDRLHTASYDELRRIIREEEPPRPSTRISTLAADLATTVAGHRRTDAHRLSHEVRGELDWIVMKALDKDRNRRYETPSSLARDVERYLHDEPVQACPPSASYRLRKFLRRNKVAAAFICLLIAGVATLTVSNIQSRSNEQRAITESARAQAVSNLLQEMLGSADAAQGKGVDYKVRQLLDDFAGGLSGQLTEQPEAEADIQATIGRAYRSLKLPEKAQPLFEKAIKLRRHMDGPESEKLAAILVDYAWNLNDQQRYTEAESQVQDALKIYRQLGVTAGPFFHALEILQHVLINAGRDEEAERVTQEALEVARQSGQEFADQANLLHRYAGLKIRQGDFAKAEELAHQSVDMHRRLHGEHHPETAFGLTTLARALAPQQKLAEAEAAAHESLAIFRRQFPDDHPNVRDTIDQLRTVLDARGDKAALEALTKEEKEYAMRSGSPDYHIRLAEILTNQSRPVLQPEDVHRLSLDAAIRAEEAHRHIRQAVEAYDRMTIEYPDDLNRRLRATSGFVEILKVCVAAPGFADEVDELNRRLTEELPKLLAAFPNSSECEWQTTRAYSNWAFGLEPYGPYLPQVEHALSKAIELIEKRSLSDPKQPGIWLYLAGSYTALGDAQWRLSRLEHAAAAFRRAMEIYDQHAAEIAADATPRDSCGIAAHYMRLGYFLACTHRDEEANRLIRQAADYAKRVTGPVDSITALGGLALVQLRLGDVAGYRQYCNAVADVSVADDLTKVRSINTWCCGPDSLEDMSLVVKRADELVANNSLGQRHIVLYVSGAALYRDRQYDRAAERLQESIDTYPSNPAPWYDMINFQRLFLAMTKWQQGRRDEARRLLAETLPALNKELQSPSCSWIYRLGLEVLRGEAKTLIEPKETDEAAENKSGTNDEPDHPQP